MARPSANPKSNKKPRGMVLDMMKEQAYKDEPSFGSLYMTNLELIQAFGWYSENMGVSDARKFLNAYLENRDERGLIDQLNGVSDAFFPLTAAWIARMIARGAHFDSVMQNRIYKRINEAIQHIELGLDGNEKTETRKPVSVKTSAKADIIMAEIEGKIDDDRNFNLYDLLVAREYPANMINRVLDRFSSMRDEILNAIKRKDEQVVEAYGGYSAKQLNELLTFYNRMLTEAVRYQTLNKKIRKSKTDKFVAIRKPKATNEIKVDEIAEKPIKEVTVTPKPSKTVSGVEYMKKYEPHNLNSLNPSQIIGSKEIWTYNPKYEFITLIRAQPGALLDLKGSLIINIDTDTSLTKRVGKKVAEYIERVKSARNSTNITAMMKALNAKPCVLQTRLNANTVIVKSFSE